jgi:uncharacterized protein (DUF2147 family)
MRPERQNSVAHLLHYITERIKEPGILKGVEMRLLILVACSLILACVPAAAADPKGVWLVEDKSAQIQIENCGGAYWGIVIWERSPGRDTENPDPSLRGRATLGIPILLDMRPVVQQRPNVSEMVWHGQIYNAMNGRTYDASIKLVTPDVLHLEGCVLGGLFCGGQNWTRVAAARGPAPTLDVCSRVADLARGTH